MLGTRPLPLAAIFRVPSPEGAGKPIVSGGNIILILLLLLR